jgi:spore germination protein
MKLFSQGKLWQKDWKGRKRNMTKRNMVRVVSYTLCAFALVCGIAISQFSKAQRYEEQMEQNYQRAFYDLVDYVKEVDVTLEKSRYSSSTQRVADMAGQIWAQAEGAKASLGQLPLSDTQLDNLSRFLSQVGDYSYVLAQKLVDGETLTEDENEMLQKLSDYCNTLNQALQNMEERMNNGRLSVGEIKTMALGGEESLSAFSTSFQNVETEFSEYPSLVYDGPYSDHMAQRESVLLKNYKEVTEEEARQKAAQLLGVEPDQLEGSEGLRGTIATYGFTYTAEDEVTSVEISKQGGWPLYFLNSRAAGAPIYSHERAKEIAAEFLAAHGYENMKESYAIEKDGILVVNFASTQGDYICYPDLVEVGVALDTGEVAFLEGSSYLMNHCKRKIPTPKLTLAQAQNNLHEDLTVLKTAHAVIPTDSGGEKFVYGFLCQNEKKQKYLVYLNTQTGEEEDMLLLIQDEKGSLTM